jgi:glutamate 5-kinase
LYLIALIRRERPENIHQLQAAAAVGQMGLVQTYESLFTKQSIHTAQVLLTHDNLENIEQSNNHLLFIVQCFC